MLSFLRNLFIRDNLAWHSLIPALERGNEAELKLVLWKEKNTNTNYSLATGLLQKLAKPKGTLEGLKVYKTHRNGKFLLVILELLWSEDDFPYSPIIINLQNNQIAGIMLAFNEIAPYLSKSDSKAIGALATTWVKWCISKRFP